MAAQQQKRNWGPPQVDLDASKQALRIAQETHQIGATTLTELGRQAGKRKQKIQYYTSVLYTCPYPNIDFSSLPFITSLISSSSTIRCVRNIRYFNARVKSKTTQQRSSIGSSMIRNAFTLPWTRETESFAAWKASEVPSRMLSPSPRWVRTILLLQAIER